MHSGDFGKRVISILGEVNGCVGGFLSEDNLPFDLMGSVFDTNQLRRGAVPGKLRNAGVRQNNALRAYVR